MLVFIRILYLLLPYIFNKNTKYLMQQLVGSVVTTDTMISLHTRNYRKNLFMPPNVVRRRVVAP